ncbi:TPA: hypothetical protein ACHJGS_003587, partial [Escherichia coli]
MSFCRVVALRSRAKHLNKNKVIFCVFVLLCSVFFCRLLTTTHFFYSLFGIAHFVSPEIFGVFMCMFYKWFFT